MRRRSGVLKVALDTFEALVVLHSFGAGGQAQTEVSLLDTCVWKWVNNGLTARGSSDLTDVGNGFASGRQHREPRSLHCKALVKVWTCSEAMA